MNKYLIFAETNDEFRFQFEKTVEARNETEAMDKVRDILIADGVYTDIVIISVEKI